MSFSSNFAELKTKDVIPDALLEDHVPESVKQAIADLSSADIEVLKGLADKTTSHLHLMPRGGGPVMFGL